jgi:DNA ligase-1
MQNIQQLPTLYKRAVTGKVSQWTIEVQGNQYRTISGYTDGKHVTSEWYDCTAKNVGRSNETTAEQQALLEAQATWKKNIEKGYFEDINKIDTGTLFKPMLANKWEDQKDKVVFPLFSQPKLDGIRCIVKSDGMWTRTGKPIISAPHIFESLKPLLERHPDLILDGELYADKFANDFNAIVSLVKKTKPTQKDLEDSAKVIEYHIYDVPGVDEVFTARMRFLANLDLPQCCVKVSTDQIDTLNDLTAYYEDYIIAGYEGQMLRTDTKYENKRTNALLKHKSFQDSEYTILEVCEGNGKFKDRVGYMVFQNELGHTFHSTVNGTQEYLEQLWSERDTLVGQLATVKYFNLTPDTQVPRFPKVTAIRNYE